MKKENLICLDLMLNIQISLIRQKSLDMSRLIVGYLRRVSLMVSGILIILQILSMRMMV